MRAFSGQEDVQLQQLEDPDPMLRALFGNVVELEQDLSALKTSVLHFQRAAGFLCVSMMKLAHNIGRLCAKDPALAEDTGEFAQRTTQLAGTGPGSLRSLLLARLEAKVLQPLNVNLDVVRDVQQRVKERETLRKAVEKRKKRRLIQHDEKTEELDKMTKELFEELTALFQHRFDLIRGPYQALKNMQLEFFESGACALSDLQNPAPRPATSAEPPRAPPPKESKSAVEMLRETNVKDSERFQQERMKSNSLARRSESVTRLLRRSRESARETESKREEEIIVAVPEDVGFNPDADRPSAGTVYAGLGRAQGDDAVGTSFAKRVGDEGASEVNPKFHGASEIGPIKIHLNKKRKESSNVSEKVSLPRDSDFIIMPAPGDFALKRKEEKKKDEEEGTQSQTQTQIHKHTELDARHRASSSEPEVVSGTIDASGIITNDEDFGDFSQFQPEITPTDHAEESEENEHKGIETASF